MTTAAIYLRQSKEKKDSVSIEAQLEKCKIVCQLNGWDFISYDDPQSVKEKCEYVKEILDYFSSDEYKDTITAIGLSSRFDNCYVDFYGKCRVVFGKPENIEKKVKKATEILQIFSLMHHPCFFLI